MTNKAYRLQPPYRGQPLDVAYLYQIVDSMSALADSVAQDALTEFAFKNQIRTVVSSLGIEAGTLSVAKPAGNSGKFTYSFKTSFKESPVVTTSIEQLDSKGHLVDVSISAISNASVTFNVVFNATSPPPNCIIHINAIGIRRKT